jgi:hypothetical protein
MRLGLVTDVHNHAAPLARALDLFSAHGVDQVVTIGDTFDAFAHEEGAAEVATLLHGRRAVGVWADFARGIDGRWRFIEAGPGSCAGTAHETVFKAVARRLRGTEVTFPGDAVGGPL